MLVCEKYFLSEKVTCLVVWSAIVSTLGRLSSWLVSVLDSGTEGPRFKSQPRCCRVTVLGKLFTSHPSCLCSPSSEIGSSRQGLRAAYCRVYDCHLQADCQEPGSAPEPYDRQSSMGYHFFIYTKFPSTDWWRHSFSRSTVSCDLGSRLGIICPLSRNQLRTYFLSKPVVEGERNVV